VQAKGLGAFRHSRGRPHPHVRRLIREMDKSPAGPHALPIAGVVLAVVLAATGSLIAQRAPQSPLSVEEIAAAIGTDADAAGVFSAIFAHMFRSTAGSRQIRESLLLSQLRPEWLPVVEGVDFDLMTAVEAEALIQNCGRYWFVTRVDRADKVVTVVLNRRCACAAREYVVSLNGDEWRLGPPGTGENGRGWGPGMTCGCAGRPAGCPCFPRAR
jgi:hypothetical protein